MLALETRASAAVGVGISITTIPAAAYVGVAAGNGELAKVWGAVAVLGVNIVMLLNRRDGDADRSAAARAPRPCDSECGLGGDRLR